MKNKSFLITALVFFFLFNTSYFWEGLPGLWDIVLTLALILVFVTLSLCLLNQCYQLIREKFSDKQRIVTVVVLSLVLGLAVLFPSGLINFERLEGEDTLVAQREGSANCMTTFRLKKNKRFSQQSVCFGVDTKKGDYTIKKDTIFLNYTSRGDSSDFAFAIIKKDSPYTGHAKGELNLFRNKDDVNPLFLLITKYEQGN